MLLCGIVNELEGSMLRTEPRTEILSYFFCQATDSRINSATSVLRGLLYLLIDQQPSLVSHVRKKHDHAGKALFEDANAWTALSEIFVNILQDPNLDRVYLIIDALDECISDLPKLLAFIVQMQNLSTSCRAKWIISSRNLLDIEEHLDCSGHKLRLCLELNAESISTAVEKFIEYKVPQLAQKKGYDRPTQKAVSDHLFSNANDTFLWVALVCQNLEKILRLDVLTKLNDFPPGLDSIYRRMVQQITNSDKSHLCEEILASIAVVYRPITLEELTSLTEMREDIATNLQSVRDVVSLCGSFLTVQQGTIYFVHQSAKDFLFEKADSDIFPSGQGEVHYRIFSRSLQVMSKTLGRDMYSLRALGYPAEQVKGQNPDPLATVRYSCIYWIDHLRAWSLSSSTRSLADLRDRGAIHQFLSEKYLYWLEALSLFKSMSKGVLSMGELEVFMQVMYALVML
jgi:hypothetical protein